MFSGNPKTTKDLQMLAKVWHSKYTGYLSDIEEKRKDIIRRVHAAGGYDLVGIFARMVGIPRKQAIAIAREERKKPQRDIGAEIAEVAVAACGYGGEARFRRSDATSKTREKKARRPEVYDELN
ncbi:MAG: hypothetical protein K6T65_10440 [Peptococcaceae bacterium]|nr:hypothetical protein [Peptococcaceae bacterium]